MVRIKQVFLIPVVMMLVLQTTSAQKTDCERSETKVLKKVERMLEALGGRENWASLKSLYIRAIHTEKGIDKPYQNEIWRNIDTRQIKIVQQNEDFHTVGYIDGDRGWIIRNQGEAKEMSEQQLAGLLHWDKHLIYGIFHRIAENRPGLCYRIDKRQRLVVYHDGGMLAAFEFNEKGLPYKFYTPSPDGKKENMSIFSQWGESEGFVHPVVSEPQGEATVFRAEEWKPGKTLLKIRFSPEKEKNK